MPFAEDIDHLKIIKLGESVTKPVNKKDKEDCERAKAEFQQIASSFPRNCYVIYTDGSVLDEYKDDGDRKAIDAVPRSCGAGLLI